MSAAIVPPIAGPGSEPYCFTSGFAYCGDCGYTGRVKGPRQTRCPQWMWHAWLERCVELLESNL